MFGRYGIDPIRAGDGRNRGCYIFCGSWNVTVGRRLKFRLTFRFESRLRSDLVHCAFGGLSWHLDRVDLCRGDVFLLPSILGNRHLRPLPCTQPVQVGT